jgi:hypothetical protein
MASVIWLWVLPLALGLLAALGAFVHYRLKGYPRYQCALVGLLALGVVGSAIQAVSWLVSAMVIRNG